MGNALDGGGPRRIELTLGTPRMEPPQGKNGQPTILIAKVGTVDDRGKSKKAQWGEAVVIELPDLEHSLLVSILTAEQDAGDVRLQIWTEVSLPLGGAGGLIEQGLCPDGEPLRLRIALKEGARCGLGSIEEQAEELKAAMEAVSPDTPSLDIQVRELPSLIEASPGSDGDRPSGVQLPAARRQIAELELQNTALARRARVVSGASGMPVMAAPSHVRQLLLIQTENEQLKNEKASMWQKLEKVQVVLSKAAAGEIPTTTSWSKATAVLQQELNHCKERQQKIHANYEERVRGLHSQLRQARAKAAAAVDGEAHGRHRKEEAIARREALQRQYASLRLANQEVVSQRQRQNEDAKVIAMQSSNPAFAAWMELYLQQQQELEAVQEELATMPEDEPPEAWKKEHIDQDTSVQQLNEELEELWGAREDERVRSESEVRELRSERDTARDRLEEVQKSFQQAKAKVDAVRALHEQEAAPPPDPELERLRAENAAAAAKLDELLKAQEAKNLAIKELEEEQEALIDKAGFISAKAALPRGSSGSEELLRLLEGKVATLGLQLHESETACEALRRQLEQLKAAEQAAKTRAQGFQDSCDALQRSSDERLLAPQARPLGQSPEKR